MTVRPILKAPHPALKRKAKRVANIDSNIKNLLNDMVETMYAAPGIGLAGPQIGEDKQLVVIHLDYEEGEPLKLINPELLTTGMAQDTKEEGCLSMPEQFADITRPIHCTVRYTTPAGAPITLKAEGLLARCLQHEIDHLKGKLFTDHLSALRRNMIMRRLAKQQRDVKTDDQ